MVDSYDPWGVDYEPLRPILVRVERALEDVKQEMVEMRRESHSMFHKLQHLMIEGDNLMANIDALRAAQADQGAALAELGTLIEGEAAQVSAILADLVAAVGNQVSEADVAAAVAAADRLRELGSAVSAIAPDAPVDPPADPPVV
jgi:glycerate-2-kinase